MNNTAVLERSKTKRVESNNVDVERLKKSIDELGIYLESSRDRYENDVKENLKSIIESLAPDNRKAIDSILENSTAKRLRCEVRDSLEIEVKKIPIQDLANKFGSDAETTKRRLLICILANLLSEPEAEDCKEQW